jgi:hypothetical protein
MFFISCGLLTRSYAAFVDVADLFPLALSAVTLGITALACVLFLRTSYTHLLTCVNVGLSLMLAWTIHPQLARRSKLLYYLSSAYFGLVSSIRAIIRVMELKSCSGSL